MKSSRGEIKIHEILENEGINFQEEYEFPSLKAPNNHYVYVHINQINNKVYVGQTMNPKERWRNNGYKYRDSPRFWNAIQKYGWHNFKHIILSCGLSQEEANQQEIYWIDKFNSIDENYGYNLTPGGNNYMSDFWKDQNFRKRMSQSFSKSRKQLWKDKDFKSKTQQALLNGLQRAWNDRRWREERISNIMGSNNPNSKRVQNIETGKIFDTIKEATIWAGLKSVSCIGENCRGHKKSAGKHPTTGEKLHWRYITSKGGDY